MIKFKIILFVQKYKYLEIRFNDVVYCQNVAQLTKNEMSKLNFSSSFIPGVEIWDGRVIKYKTNILSTYHKNKFHR